MKSPVSQFFRTNNIFREISTKSSPKRGLKCRSPVDAMSEFEETLIERMRNIIPKSEREVGSLEWVKSAMECLCAVHVDLQNLMLRLDLPVTTWDEAWIEIYLDTSVKLLDLCIAFSSEIARLNQGNLLVRCAVNGLDRDVKNQMTRVQSSFASWNRSISSRNKRMENFTLILNGLVEKLEMPKSKTCGKRKVLMSGMYGVRVLSAFLCGVLGTIFTGASENMVEFRVAESCKWGAVYGDLERFTNGGLKKLMAEREGGLLNEVKTVNDAMRKIEGDEAEWLNGLRGGVERLSNGLGSLENRVNDIFKVVLGGRDGVLSSLRSSINVQFPIEIPTLKLQTVV